MQPASSSVEARIRLQFCPSSLPDYAKWAHKCWISLPKSLATIADLQHHIAINFYPGVVCELSLLLDGFALLPRSAIGCVRDGDLINVAVVSQAAPPLQQVPPESVATAPIQAGSQQAVAQAQEDAAPGSAPAAAADVQTHKRQQQQQQASRKKQRAGVQQPAAEDGLTHAAATAAAGAGISPLPAAATQSASVLPAGSLPALQGVAPSSQPAQAHADKPRPSRSARRKAAKRRLRREGILPYTPGYKKQRAPAAAAAAAQTDAAQQSPAAGTAAQHAAAAAMNGGVGSRSTPPPWLHLAAGASPLNPNGWLAGTEHMDAVQHAPMVTVPMQQQPAPVGRDANQQQDITPQRQSQQRTAREQTGGPVAAQTDPLAKHTQQAEIAVPATAEQAHGEASSSSSESDSDSDSELSSSSSSDDDDSSSSDASSPSSSAEASGTSTEKSSSSSSSEERPGHASNIANGGPSECGNAAVANGHHGNLHPVQPQQVVLPPFNALPVLGQEPRAGDVLAYQLLEMSAAWQPQVSGVRYGCVSVFDSATRCITLTPWPDAGQHPCAAQLAAWQATQQEEHGDAEELAADYHSSPWACQYTEQGVLSCDMSAFTCVKLALRDGVQLPAGTAQQQAVNQQPEDGVVLEGHLSKATPAKPSTVDMAQEATADVLLIQPQQPGKGPPRPASKTPTSSHASTVPAVGAFAELMEQLNTRKQQLADSAAAGGPIRPASRTQPPARASEQQQQQQDTAVAACNGQHAEVAATPETETAHAAGHNALANGVTGNPHVHGKGSGIKPRPGVRRGAMGGVLKMLRSRGIVGDQS